MKSLGKFLKYKKIKKEGELDKETVFYLFKKIVKKNYGDIGKREIIIDFYKKGIIFLKIQNSNWANEVWLNKKVLIDEINKKIGGDDIKDIKIKN